MHLRDCWPAYLMVALLTWHQISQTRWYYRKVYLHSPYWKLIRAWVGRRANWTCEISGCRKSGRHLNAHHTTYAVLRWEWLHIRTLYWLCPRHHSLAHGGKSQRTKRGHTLEPYRRKSHD